MLVVPVPFAPITETALSFVGASSSSSADIAPPAGAAVGDLGIICDVMWEEDLATGSFGLPDGWFRANYVFNAGLSFGIQIIAKALAPGDFPDVVTGDVQGASINRKVMLALRADNGFSELASGSWGFGFTSGSQGGQSIATSGQVAPVLALAFAGTRNGSSFNWEDQSPAFAQTAAIILGSQIIRYGVTIHNSSPADQYADINDIGSSNFLVTGFLRVSP